MPAPAQRMGQEAQAEKLIDSRKLTTENQQPAELRGKF